MKSSFPEIKIFEYIEEGDFFVISPENEEIANSLNLTEWNSVVWIGRLMIMDNDFGEHWFDNWDEREEKTEIAEKLGYDTGDILVINPDRFKDGKDGPCNTDGFRKLFWTDILKNLHLNLATIIKKSIELTDNEQEIDKINIVVGEILKKYDLSSSEYEELVKKKNSIEELFLSDKKIKEISDDLQAGLRLYINKTTKEVFSMMDPDNAYYDESMFGDELENYEKNKEDLIEIDKMPSNTSFRVMEGFIEEVSDVNLRMKLISALERRRPFRGFKDEVEYSDYREKWFKYRDERYFNWVKKQVKSIAWLIEESD